MNSFVACRNDACPAKSRCYRFVKREGQTFFGSFDHTARLGTCSYFWQMLPEDLGNASEHSVIVDFSPWKEADHAE